MGVQRQTKNHPDRPIPKHTFATEENSLTLVLIHVMMILTTKGVLELITPVNTAMEIKSNPSSNWNSN